MVPRRGMTATKLSEWERGITSINLSDFKAGESLEIPITKYFITNFFLRENYFTTPITLENCLDMANKFSLITNREMMVALYTHFPSNMMCYNERGYPLFKWAEARIGTEKQVYPPQFNVEIYKKIFERLDHLYLPVFTMHTHPHAEEGVLASEADLRLTRRTLRKNGITVIKGKKKERMWFEVENNLIHIISGLNMHSYENLTMKNDYLFYQYTGNIEAYEELMGNYDKRLDETFSIGRKQKEDEHGRAMLQCMETTKPSIATKRSKYFARKLEESKAFKAISFNGRELFEKKELSHILNGEKTTSIFIKEDAAEKISRKFPYKIIVKRTK